MPGGEPPGGGRSRPRLETLVALGLAAAGCGGGSFAPPPHPTVAPAAPPAPRPAPAPSPEPWITLPEDGTGDGSLGPELLERMDREIEDLLGARFDRRGRLEAAGPRSFAEVAEEIGVAVLDNAPAETEVLRRLARRDPGAPLPADIREHLERHDRDLRDLGFPPTFAPFLDLPPASKRGSVAAAAAAEVAIADLEERLRKGELPRVEVGLFNDLKNGPAADGLDQTLNGYRDHPEGRGVIETLTREGLVHARRYLLLRSLELGADRAPGVEARALETFEVLFRLRPLLLGRILTASTRRLFGEPATAAPAIHFQASVLDHLGNMQRRFLLPAPESPRTPLHAYRACLRRALEQGQERLAAWSFERALRLHDFFDEPQAVRDLAARHAERLLPHVIPGRLRTAKKWIARARGGGAR